MSKNPRANTRLSRETALKAIDGMEPELRQLTGLMVALRVLGEADDAIDPVAISSLARSAGNTLEDVEQLWRTAIEALRSA